MGLLEYSASTFLLRRREKMIKERVRNKDIQKKITDAYTASLLIKDGMNVATSGFTMSGYPKAVPAALAKRIKETGEKLKINLWTGASVGDELDGELARAGIINRRLPYQTNDSIRNVINSGEVSYIDIHLSHVSQEVRYGFYGDIDVAIVEACAIDQEGNIIPTTSVGNTPTFIEKARKLIIELNIAQPEELEGIHDIYTPEDPPKRQPIPILKADDRIGTTYIKTDPSKIEAIVITNKKDTPRPFSPIDDTSRSISSHLIEFLKNEVAHGRLPKDLLPLQSGVGSVSNAVLHGLIDSGFNRLDFYTEVIQDTVLDLIDAGKVRMASATAFSFSEKGLEKFINKVEKYRQNIILRPQEISNHPEIIRRLGLIAMNTAIEADIYGNVNSTHIAGTRMMNGIGGSGDFARNAYLSIFTTPSVIKGGRISCIVPMASHIDHTEHDVKVIITEQGVADLRGLSPRERARVIIDNCAHPDYRPLLHEYLRYAEKTTLHHTPHILEEAFSWHIKLAKEGSMR
jgi:succinyl-CoA:acetate CoA-transferase